MNRHVSCTAWPSVVDGKFDILGVDYLDENEVYRAEIFFSGGVP